MLFVGARFVVFKSVVKLQKREFRQLVLKQQHKTFKQVFVSIKDLYKDVNGLEWKENNKEIVIKNTYYEVLSVTKQGSVCVVNIIEDKMENELFANFFEKSDSGKGLADQLLLVFAMNFVLPQQQEIKQPADNRTEYCNANAPTSLSGFYSKTIKPPRA
ncbi:MAG: hypothetical protein IPJ60_04180 [Sphingobacteriaceae bacterium]|nr:hypothetical protein [Sphingobacteriaceae bacterium]